MTATKPTNPKDAIGCGKPPLSVIPCPVLFEVGWALRGDRADHPLSVIPWPVMFEAGLALLEGACKYGRHNYRTAGVRASIYYDAAMRHMMPWWHGEDIDPDSGLSHVTKAIAGLIVLRDAMRNNMWNDDRPPIPWQPKECKMSLADGEKYASVLFGHAVFILMQWWEGVNSDQDQNPSVTSAIAVLVTLRDSMMRGILEDDRPSKRSPWMPALHADAKTILARYPNPLPPHVAAKTE